MEWYDTSFVDKMNQSSFTILAKIANFLVYDFLLYCGLTPLRRGIFRTNLMQSFVHDPHTTISDDETLIKDLLVILKRMFPRYCMHSDMFSLLKYSTIQ